MFGPARRGFAVRDHAPGPPDNRDAFEHHLARWRPLASKLLREGAELLATRGGGDTAAIARAGEHALDDLHARAGLA